MDKDELLKALVELEKGYQPEAHIAADELLLKYIGDPRIDQAFWKVALWHA